MAWKYIDLRVPVDAVAAIVEQDRMWRVSSRRRRLVDLITAAFEGRTACGRRGGRLGRRLCRRLGRRARARRAYVRGGRLGRRRRADALGLAPHVDALAAPGARVGAARVERRGAGGRLQGERT